MIAIVWNCRGLGNASTVWNLRDLIISHKPNVIFLSKIKCRSTIRLCNFVHKFSFCNMELVPAKGYAGGLMLFWTDVVDISVTFANDNMINCSVINDPLGKLWQFTAVYGPPTPLFQSMFWDTLNQIELLSQELGSS